MIKFDDKEEVKSTGTGNYVSTYCDTETGKIKITLTKEEFNEKELTELIFELSTALARYKEKVLKRMKPKYQLPPIMVEKSGWASEEIEEEVEIQKIVIESDK